MWSGVKRRWAVRSQIHEALHIHVQLYIQSQWRNVAQTNQMSTCPQQLLLFVLYDILTKNLQPENQHYQTLPLIMYQITIYTRWSIPASTFKLTTSTKHDAMRWKSAIAASDVDCGKSPNRSFVTFDANKCHSMPQKVKNPISVGSFYHNDT